MMHAFPVERVPGGQGLRLGLPCLAMSALAKHARQARTGILAQTMASHDAVDAGKGMPPLQGLRPLSFSIH